MKKMRKGRGYLCAADRGPVLLFCSVGAEYSASAPTALPCAPVYVRQCLVWLARIHIQAHPTPGRPRRAHRAVAAEGCLRVNPAPQLSPMFIWRVDALKRLVP